MALKAASQKLTCEMGLTLAHLTSGKADLQQKPTHVHKELRNYDQSICSP